MLSYKRLLFYCIFLCLVVIGGIWEIRYVYSDYLFIYNKKSIINIMLIYNGIFLKIINLMFKLIFIVVLIIK